MNRIKAIGLGAGGHCKVIIEMLQMQENVDVVGLLIPDDGTSMFQGVPILGDDDWIENALSLGITHFFIGVGTVRATPKRAKLFELGLSAGLIPLNVIHPNVVIAQSVKMGRGVTIMCGTILDTEVIIGDNVIMNVGAIVCHETVIGNHTHVSGRTVVSGGCTVGENCLIGIGACVINGINIGHNVTVGAGSVVIRDVPDHLTVVGVPAKPIQKHH